MHFQTLQMAKLSRISNVLHPLEICENAWGDDDCSNMVTARGCGKLVSGVCAKACNAC